MVLIHNMDSDEEQLQIVSFEEAYAASHAENRLGIKMTPKVPPQFDGQSTGKSLSRFFFLIFAHPFSTKWF